MPNNTAEGLSVEGQPVEGSVSVDSDQGFEAALARAAGKSRDGETSEPTAKPEAHAPERDDPKEIQRAILAPDATVANGLEVILSEPADPGYEIVDQATGRVESQHKTEAEAQEALNSEWRRQYEEAGARAAEVVAEFYERTNPNRLAGLERGEAQAAIETALAYVREGASPDTYDRALQSLEGVAWVLPADALAEVDYHSEDAELLEDVIAQDVLDQGADARLRASQAAMQAQADQAAVQRAAEQRQRTFIDAANLTQEKLGLTPEQGALYFTEAIEASLLDPAALLAGPAEEILPSVAAAMATVEQAYRADRVASFKADLLESDTGNVGEGLRVLGSDGQWHSTQEIYASHPLDLMRVEERLQQAFSPNREPTLTKGEFRREILSADDGTSWEGGLTTGDGKTPTSWDVATGARERFEREQRERAAEAASALGRA